MSHLLVVEDDPDTCEFVRQALTAAGHRVSATFMTDEALAAMAGARPDAALVDVVLPTDSRFAVVSHAVELGIPVVMMSGVVEAQQELDGCGFSSVSARIRRD